MTVAELKKLLEDKPDTFNVMFKFLDKEAKVFRNFSVTDEYAISYYNDTVELFLKENNQQGVRDETDCKS